MKGSIAQCAEDLVRAKFGDEKWESVCEAAGLPANTRFLPSANVDDGATVKVINAIGTVCGLSSTGVADAFGEYWVCDYAPRLYPSYFRGANSARDLLLSMDSVHDKVTRTMPNAHPPKFGYNWTDENTLVMDYSSARGLVGIFVGLVKGVGLKYGENLAISTAGTRVTIRFPAAA